MKVGDKFRLYCDHEGCKRFIVMELWCESMVEKLPLFRLLGMLSGILGVGLILYNGSNILSSFSPGVGLVFVGLLCWSLATSVGHKIKVAGPEQPG